MISRHGVVRIRQHSLGDLPRRVGANAQVADRDRRYTKRRMMVPLDQGDLTTELQKYANEFAAVRRDGESLVDGLSEAQIAWHENEASWSIGDCLNHLAVTGNLSVANIRPAIAVARARGLLGSGSFLQPVPGRLLIWLMDAPPRIRFRAPKAYRPQAGQSVPQVLTAFFALQDDLMKVLREANGVDLTSVKVVNPVTSWFRLTIGQELALTAAHERRHLWQAWRVRRRLAHASAVS